MEAKTGVEVALVVGADKWGVETSPKGSQLWSPKLLLLSSLQNESNGAFVSPSGAQGLTLKAGEQLPTPTAPTRQSRRNFISLPTSVKSRKRMKTVLISPKGKILFDITDKALKIAFDKRGPR